MTDVTFCKDFTVLQVDCDLQNRMTLGALLRATQQIATDHCDSIGLSGAFLAEHGVAFLLAKMGVELTRDIHLGEILSVTTHPCMPRHAFYNRYTDFRDSDGHVVARVDARWVLVDIHTHRILRNPPQELTFPFGDWVDWEQHLALSRPAALEPAGDACAVYSRVDINGHLNNTYYGDILCDALPTEVWLATNGFRRAVLFYRQELPLGNRMELLRGRMEDGGWYVEGVLGDNRCFEGSIQFETEDGGAKV